MFPAALLVAAALSIGALALIGHLRGDGSAAGEEVGGMPPPAAPPAGAFAEGGRPVYGDERAREALSEALPRYAIALDIWARKRRGQQDPTRAKKELDEARAALLSDSVRASLGARAFRALETVADRAYAAARAGEAGVDEAADELSRGVLTLNDALAAAGLGYFADSDVLTYGDGERRVVLMFTFRVEHVSRYRSGGREIRALRLRRLDSLNWTYRLLGFTATHRREALVLLNRIDERLLGGVIPALSPGASADLWDLSPEDRESTWYPRLSARASEIVREELGGEAEATDRLGQLVGRRLALFKSWNEVLAARQLILQPPETLTLEEDLGARLTGAVPQEELEELRRLEEELASTEAGETFAALRRKLVLSVERHEVQHRVDDLAPALAMPDRLAELVGPLHDGEGTEREVARRARAELSAYLAELARDDATGRLGLTLIAGFLVDRRMWGSGECYAALVIFDELARELGVDRKPPLLRGRRIDQDRAVELYIELSRKPAPALRKAARRAWERLFTRELPRLEQL